MNRISFLKSLLGQGVIVSILPDELKAMSSFLPMADNLVLSNIIEGGIALHVEILHVEPQQVPWEMCEVGVYLTYPKTSLIKSRRQ
ncbi:MAG: hypothetical protein ACK4GN_14220 [Runella sp.]